MFRLKRTEESPIGSYSADNRLVQEVLAISPESMGY